MPDNLQRLNERYTFLLQKNEESRVRLAEAGIEPTFDSVVAKRLEMLIDTLLGDANHEERLEFEIAFQEYMEKVFANGDKTIKEFQRQQRMAALSGRRVGTIQGGIGGGGVVRP